MPNEEIAKDLTVSLINKMTNPTPDSVSEAYLSILQKITDPTRVTTLQTIHVHLAKQDDDSIVFMRDTSIAFAGSIILSGIILAVANSPLRCHTITDLFNIGVGIAIIGVVVLIAFPIIAEKMREKRKRENNQLP